MTHPAEITSISSKERSSCYEPAQTRLNEAPLAQIAARRRSGSRITADQQRVAGTDAIALARLGAVLFPVGTVSNRRK
jgi:hypothetical protein